ncbi:MAG: hypothetical protein A2Y90_03675 [Chloroflexi bacterium RBG_13_52_12]|nr:MAG: hypothetical protein A2Y90_03675 [Chloroflexi bacterium RBG_13_52_12]
MKKRENNTIRNYYYLLAVIILLVLFLYFIGIFNLDLKLEIDRKNNQIEQQNIELKQQKVEFAVVSDYWNITLSGIQNRSLDIRLCVEPYIPVIRDVAVAVVTDPPFTGQSDNPAWKIWRINYWIVNNIESVADPNGFDYFALASETMLIRAGDCEDSAILLASMYESIGLDAGLVYVDTDNDNIRDHLSCAVYYPNDKWSFIDEEKAIMTKLQLTRPSGEVQEMFYEAANWEFLSKYDLGTWIIVDPVRGIIPGYVFKQDYSITQVIDVGN